jgi:preprotein translocase subunit SecE
MNGSSTSTNRTSIGEFIRQVRQEAAKVTWPTRKETLITTGMVFAMSIVAAIFFFVVDQLLSLGIRAILVGFGG